MRVTIVGLGLMGGSAGLALKARGFASTVVGVEANPAHAKRALALGLVDEIRPLAEALGDADLVILAIPVDAMIVELPRILDGSSATGTVTDFGSTKNTLCAAVVNHPNRSRFVPSHPMAGTENSGPDAARADLFDGKTAVICDHGNVDPSHRQRVESMYGALRMRLIYLGPEAHDLHAAYVSHLSHISSFVLANTVLEKEKDVRTIFDLAGGGFDSTVRLAKSSPEMWAPIFEQNREHIVDALGAYIGQLQAFQQALLHREVGSTLEIMRDANRIRGVLANLGTRVERRK